MSRCGEPCCGHGCTKPTSRHTWASTQRPSDAGSAVECPTRAVGPHWRICLGRTKPIYGPKPKVRSRGGHVRKSLPRFIPHRWAIPRDVWARFFESSEHEIGVLAYSALFLAEDAGLLGIIEDKALNGVRVRLALGDPDSPSVALRGQEEGIGDAMGAKVRNALVLYRPLSKVENVEVRLHRTILYNSIYRADDEVFVNQHAYGIPAAHSPMFRYHESESGNIATTYLDSFDRVWISAKSI